MNNTTSSPLSPLTLHRRWLVVDDEVALSELMADNLTELGLASVENFTSPNEALSAFSTRSGGFDIVVTDRDMPGVDGLELSRLLHLQAPEVKVILVSANAEVPPADLERAGISAVVSKPFRLSTLEAAIRALLPLSLVADVSSEILLQAQAA